MPSFLESSQAGLKGVGNAAWRTYMGARVQREPVSEVCATYLAVACHDSGGGNLDLNLQVRYVYSVTLNMGCVV